MAWTLRGDTGGFAEEFCPDSAELPVESSAINEASGELFENSASRLGADFSYIPSASESLKKPSLIGAPAF